MTIQLYLLQYAYLAKHLRNICERGNKKTREKAFRLYSHKTEYKAAIEVTRDMDEDEYRTYISCFKKVDGSETYKFTDVI